MMTKCLGALLSSSLLLLSSLALAAPIERTICVFDIAGNMGPVMTTMKDWQIAALGWGLKATLNGYTNEAVAAEDLKAGVCDAALITGLRGRQFNKYAGTIDSIGAIPTMKHMKILLKVLADPRSADKLAANSYEVMGIAPIGAAYLFVNDRSINTLAKAAGKKVAVLDFDPTQAIMVAQVGATPIPSDITNFAGKFNNGTVDIIAAPLVAYNVLELYKGLQPDGGIIDYPLLQLSLQLIGKDDRFPPEIAQKSREYFFHNLDRLLEQVRKEAEAVNPKWWVDIPEADKREYEVMMHDGRQQLREQGYYDASMLALLQKIRCKVNPSRAECTKG
jgi:ABC-type amino acid transport substrate-binding protein